MTAAVTTKTTGLILIENVRRIFDQGAWGYQIVIEDTNSKEHVFAKAEVLFLNLVPN